MILSVVIPTCGRIEPLTLCLDSLSKLQLPWAAEILIMDNGAAPLENEFDDTCGDFSLRTIRVSEPGLHNGRNQGAVSARGKVLAYLDDDTEVDPHWWRGVESIIEGKADAIAGRILPRWHGDRPEWLSAFYRDGVCGYLTLLDRGEEFQEIGYEMVWGANFMIKRELVLQLGGFPPDGMPQDLIHLRGDGETGFFRKFNEAGYRSCYDPRALVYHHVPASRLTEEYFYRRAYNQGISDSFSHICLAQGVQDAPENSQKLVKKKKCRLMAGLEWRFRYALEWAHIIKPAENNKIKPTDTEKKIESMRQQMREAALAGYEYHQNCVKKDSDLLRWVLKPTWINDISDDT